MALSECSIVLIHIGGHLPDCSLITLKQARFMNEDANIYFLVDHGNYIRLSEDTSQFAKENGIQLVDLSQIPPTAKHEHFLEISPFDKAYKEGFWNRTTERFFYLHDFLVKTELKNVIHLETDVMLYADMEELLPLIRRKGVELAGTFQWKSECVPGFVFIQNPTIWESYIDHVIAELQSYVGNDPQTDLNDMRTLASFKKKCGSEFINLPIVMPEYGRSYEKLTVKGSHEDTGLEFISNNAGFFPGYLFDAAALGIYANGYDRTVYPDGKPGDIHWKSLFDPSKIDFSWGKDQHGRDVPYARLAEKKYRLANLHFHSKHPEGFTSFKESRAPFPNPAAFTKKRDRARMSDTKLKHQDLKFIPGHTLKRVKLSDLYANIITTIDAERVKNHTHCIPTKIKETPHYKYVMGSRQEYLDYQAFAGVWAGLGIEHSPEVFDALIKDFRYQDIIRIAPSMIIEDGVHRVSILASMGVEETYVYIRDPDQTENQLNLYFSQHVDDWREWYCPVQIGDNVQHERTYPNFEVREEFMTNGERGQARWDRIIAKNLPDITGKRVLDIGSSIGLFSINLAKLGAEYILGIDRSEDIVQPTNENLPKQSVVQQAYFIKNCFELLDQKKYNIDYEESDIKTRDFSRDRFDFVFACCILPHFGKRRMEEIIADLSRHTPQIFLQSNLGHGGELGETYAIEFQKSLLEKYGYRVEVDSPEGYKYPVLMGTKRNSWRSSIRRFFSK